MFTAPLEALGALTGQKEPVIDHNILEYMNFIR